jgi:hypothetical protein
LPPECVDASRGPASTSISAEAYVQEALHWLPDPIRFAERPGAFDPGASHIGVDVPRILLADDNSDMRGYVRRLLETR